MNAPGRGCLPANTEPRARGPSLRQRHFCDQHPLAAVQAGLRDGSHRSSLSQKPGPCRPALRLGSVPPILEGRWSRADRLQPGRLLRDLPIPEHTSRRASLCSRSPGDTGPPGGPLTMLPLAGPRQGHSPLTLHLPCSRWGRAQHGRSASLVRQTVLGRWSAAHLVGQ